MSRALVTIGLLVAATAATQTWATLESAKGFTTAMMQELGLQEIECPSELIDPARTGEDYVCSSTDLSFGKFSRAWNRAVGNLRSSTLTKTGPWSPDAFKRGAQTRDYAINSTPLEVAYFMEQQTVVISYSNYSWNKWPCPADGFSSSHDLYEALDPRVQAPKLIEAPPALYPELARVARQEGVIKLRYIIDTEGRVSEACIIQSHNRDVGFEKLTIDWILQSRFTPGTVDGKPVNVVMYQEMTYKLHK